MSNISIDVLNTGEGHLEIRLNKSDPLELEKARRVITDMLRRGYALFVHRECGKVERVRKFDEATDCYIIAEGAEVEAEEQPKRGRPKKAIPISEAKVTAVGRSAGG